MQKSLIIDSASTTGKKLQKSVTNVNPAVSNEVAGTFATMANALTTNVYNKATIVKKMDVTEAEQAVSLTADTTNYTGSATASSSTISGGVRIALDGEGYIDVTY